MDGLNVAPRVKAVARQTTDFWIIDLRSTNIGDMDDWESITRHSDLLCQFPYARCRLSVRFPKGQCDSRRLKRVAPRRLIDYVSSFAFGAECPYPCGQAPTMHHDRMVMHV